MQFVRYKVIKVHEEDEGHLYAWTPSRHFVRFILTYVPSRTRLAVLYPTQHPDSTSHFSIHSCPT